jgi:hypothetical protein
LTTITTGQSGYVQIFLFFLLFFEPFRGPVRITVLVTTYLLSIPADFTLLPVIHAPAWSYLGGRQVVADFGLSLGQLLRPAGLLIIQFGLIILNLNDLLHSGEAPEAHNCVGGLESVAAPSQRAALTPASRRLPLEQRLPLLRLALQRPASNDRFPALTARAQSGVDIS